MGRHAGQPVCWVVIPNHATTAIWDRRPTTGHLLLFWRHDDGRREWAGACHPAPRHGDSAHRDARRTLGGNVTISLAGAIIRNETDIEMVAHRVLDLLSRGY